MLLLLPGLMYSASDDLQVNAGLVNFYVCCY